MAIGEKNNLRTFTSQTSEISQFGAVNRTLSGQYGLKFDLRQTSSVDLSVPVHKKVTFSMFATVSYKYGVARIDDNGTTAYLPWLLTTNSKPITRVQSELQNC